ncbi:MAG: LLM class flavin-dependent oxidoreductase [Rhodococcus fascians]
MPEISSAPNGNETSTPCDRPRPLLALRYDFRAPAFGAPPASLMAAALEHARYGEQNGFERVQVSEHHHSEDGYCPSPFVAAAGFAARTSTLRIRLSALVLTLHDPVRAAEDLAVLDVLSAGRIELVAAAGYREIEFEMLGKSFADRGTRLRDSIRVLRDAWTGESFDHQGRPVLVRPMPVQEGGPTILLGGSTVRAAHRAAAIADGFDPTDPSLIAHYRARCQKLGRPIGECRPKVGPFFVHVSEDPPRDEHLLAPHIRHEMQAYGHWSADMPVTGSGRSTSTVWNSDSHKVLTPAECVALVRSLDPAGTFALHPLAGGIAPHLADRSLQLFVEKVLPHI